MSDFSIRTATLSDVPAIVALLKELADYEKLQDNFLLDEASAARDMLGAACHSELVFVDGAAVGIAAWFWIYKSFGAARGLYVDGHRHVLLQLGRRLRHLRQHQQHLRHQQAVLQHKELIWH